MTDRVIIDLKGEAELQAKLRKIAAAAGNLQPLLSTIGATMEANISFRFDTKTDPNGATWKPISPLTAQFYTVTAGGSRSPGKDGWKALRDGSAPKAEMPGSLLERTRKMRESLAVNMGADYVEIGVLRMTDGGKWNVAALHELGTKSMPRRGMLAGDPTAGTLGPQDRADIEVEVQRFLDGLLS